LPVERRPGDRRRRLADLDRARRRGCAKDDQRDRDDAQQDERDDPEDAGASRGSGLRTR
jgi:hypothetical protein